MDQGASIETPYQLKCKESALAKSNAVHVLVAATDGQVDGNGGVSLSSLLPILHVMNGVTMNDDASVSRAADELTSIIAEKRKYLAVEDLSAIGEVNFFEAFHSFLSYYRAGRKRQDKEIFDAPSIHNTPIGPSVSAKRVAWMRVDDAITKEVPAKKRARRVEFDLSIDDEEEKEEVVPIRKSSRPLVDNDIKIGCVFKGCPDKFKTTKELAAHAEECDRKFDLVLVFRCSVCLMTCPSHKAIESHIALNTITCPSATVIVVAVEKPREKREPKTPRKYADYAIPSIVREDHSKSQELECTFNDCKYSNRNFEFVYAHVKSNHPDQNLSFECLGCGETRQSGKSIQLHAQKCNNAKVELKLTKKQDATESEVLVAKPKFTKKTAARGSSPVKFVPPVSMVKKRRGRPPKSTKKDVEVPEADAFPMPVQDDITTGDAEKWKKLTSSMFRAARSHKSTVAVTTPPTTPSASSTHHPVWAIDAAGNQKTGDPYEFNDDDGLVGEREKTPSLSATADQAEMQLYNDVLNVTHSSQDSLSPRKTPVLVYSPISTPTTGVVSKPSSGSADRRDHHSRESRSRSKSPVERDRTESRSRSASSTPQPVAPTSSPATSLAIIDAAEDVFECNDDDGLDGEREATPSLSAAADQAEMQLYNDVLNSPHHSQDSLSPRKTPVPLSPAISTPTTGVFSKPSSGSTDRPDDHSKESRSRSKGPVERDRTESRSRSASSTPQPVAPPPNPVWATIDAARIHETGDVFEWNDDDDIVGDREQTPSLPAAADRAEMQLYNDVLNSPSHSQDSLSPRKTPVPLSPAISTPTIGVVSKSPSGSADRSDDHSRESRSRSKSPVERDRTESRSRSASSTPQPVAPTSSPATSLASIDAAENQETGDVFECNDDDGLDGEREATPSLSAAADQAEMQLYNDVLNVTHSSQDSLSLRKTPVPLSPAISTPTTGVASKPSSGSADRPDDHSRESRSRSKSAVERDRTESRSRSASSTPQLVSPPPDFLASIYAAENLETGDVVGWNDHDGLDGEREGTQSLPAAADRNNQRKDSARSNEDGQGSGDEASQEEDAAMDESEGGERGEWERANYGAPDNSPVPQFATADYGEQQEQHLHQQQILLQQQQQPHHEQIAPGPMPPPASSQCGSSGGDPSTAANHCELQHPAAAAAAGQSGMVYGSLPPPAFTMSYSRLAPASDSSLTAQLAYWQGAVNYFQSKADEIPHSLYQNLQHLQYLQQSVAAEVPLVAAVPSPAAAPKEEKPPRLSINDRLAEMGVVIRKAGGGEGGKKEKGLAHDTDEKEKLERKSEFKRSGRDLLKRFVSPYMFSHVDDFKRTLRKIIHGCIKNEQKANATFDFSFNDDVKNRMIDYTKIYVERHKLKPLTHYFGNADCLQ